MIETKFYNGWHNVELRSIGRTMADDCHNMFAYNIIGIMFCYGWRNRVMVGEILSYILGIVGRSVVGSTLDYG